LAWGLAACIGETGGSDASDPSRGRSIESGADRGAARGPSTAKGAQAAICESHAIESTSVVPDVMIVLDRSASMKLAGGDNRWDPSVRGVQAVTTLFDTSMRFGLIAFPGTDGGGVRDACRAGSLEVPVALRSSSAITT